MGITHEWVGTTLVITSDSGTSACDLKGGIGEDGPRGPQGPCNGKTAYEYAQEGGYTGTEAEFAETLADMAEGNIDLADYALKTELPTKTSQLTNDSGYIKSIPSEYITETELNSKGYLTQHQSLAGYAKTADIPTKVSQLTNDSSYITNATTGLSNYYKKSDVYTKTEINNKGYLTTHQDISGKVDKNKLSLGLHTDGLIYIFIDNQPIGNGVAMAAIDGDVVGNIDSANNIVLYGSVADGTYTVKYEKEDGTVITIGNLSLAADEPTIKYTNQIPLSTKADGTLYVGTNGEKGYKTGVRLSNSSGNESTEANFETTGFIKGVKGNTIYMKNVALGTDGKHNLVFYNASKGMISQNENKYTGNVFIDDGNGVYKYTIVSDCQFFRVSSSDINANSIITVNEPITD